jgi:hypothetical protein
MKRVDLGYRTDKIPDGKGGEKTATIYLSIFYQLCPSAKCRKVIAFPIKSNIDIDYWDPKWEDKIKLVKLENEITWSDNYS